MPEPVSPTLDAAQNGWIDIGTTPVQLHDARQNEVVTITLNNRSAAPVEVTTTIGSGAIGEVPAKGYETIGPFCGVHAPIVLSAASNGAIRALVNVARATASPRPRSS